MISLRGYFAVGLWMPRDPKNVANALRACGCFGAAFLAYSGQRYQRHAADTQKAYRHMPLINTGDEPDNVLNVVLYDRVSKGTPTQALFANGERLEAAP